MPRSEIVAELLRSAEDLHSLVPLRLARELGLTKSQFDSLARSPILDLVLPGVHRVVGAPQTLAQAALAVALCLGGETLITGAAAANIMKITNQVPRRIDALTEYGRSARQTGRLVVPTLGHGFEVRVRRSLRLAANDRVIADGVPCTSAARTLIELAGSVDEAELESMFETARRLGLVSTQHLAIRIAELGGRGTPGCRKIRDLVARQEGVDANDSELETRLWRLLRRRAFARGDAPKRQIRTVRGDGQVARIDVGWAAIKCGVESDGWEWHSGRLSWKRDRRRTASLEAAGWRLVFVTWDDVVGHPDETLLRIETAYEECRTRRGGVR